MLQCWQENPNDRPTFAKLREKMKEMERNHRVCYSDSNPIVVWSKTSVPLETRYTSGLLFTSINAFSDPNLTF